MDKIIIRYYRRHIENLNVLYIGIFFLLFWIIKDTEKADAYSCTRHVKQCPIPIYGNTILKLGSAGS